MQASNQLSSQNSSQLSSVPRVSSDTMPVHALINAQKCAEEGQPDCLCCSFEKTDKGNHADKCLLKPQPDVNKHQHMSFMRCKGHKACFCELCVDHVSKGRKKSLKKNGVGCLGCSTWFAKADEFSAAAKTANAANATKGRIIMEASPDEVTCCECQKECPEQQSCDF